MEAPKYFYFRVKPANHGTALELENASDVDVVEVVRCKDCKHSYVEGDNVRYNACELNHNNAQSDDWYCADAERREVNHESN